MVELQVLPAIRGQARILNLDGRKLQRVPPSVAKLNLLTSLRLQNNRIAKLPPELAGLSNLTELHLGNNVFEEVPEELKNFRSLQKLFMFGNKITTISTKIFDGLENLIILNLNNNKIKYIPPEIHRLSNLQHLTLNGNQLKSIPKEISLLKNIYELHLANNQLMYLPEEIVHMTNLQILCLARNQLPMLPEVENLTMKVIFLMLLLTGVKMAKLNEPGPSAGIVMDNTPGFLITQSQISLYHLEPDPVPSEIEILDVFWRHAIKFSGDLGYLLDFKDFYTIELTVDQDFMQIRLP
ncbi:leucine-rich repeat-containing protein 69 isoform X2 [Rhinatrema bivittatum]|uniref:leucine-rich repeat-containing protein 69 isoform X2 n=1 Tax=Rhinatrema bivittatum TaxID=194408 RepID=UPI00112E8675|nr:leucine-rich repeat-containing protein 69 isoform X2 [Rhinatrema bivittatum]